MSNPAAASALASAASKSIVHVAGYSSCGFYRRAASVVASLTLLFPSKFQLVEHEFPMREAYHEWLIRSNGHIKGNNVLQPSQLLDLSDAHS